MNKTQIFGMYIGRSVKYRGSAVKVTETMTGLHYEMGHIGNKKLVQKVFVICSENLKRPIDINDCQLILKSISEMSEEDRDELNKELNIFVESYQFVSNLNRITAIKFTFWLISHGYALSDEWFTNGIAIKESEAK